MTAGVTPERYLNELLAHFHDRFRDYQEMLRQAYADLHPQETGGHRSSIFRPQDTVRSPAQAQEESESVAIVDWPFIAGLALHNRLTRSDLVLRAVTPGYTQRTKEEALKAELYEFGSRGILQQLDAAIAGEESGWQTFQQVVAARLVWLAKVIIMPRLSEEPTGSGLARVSATLIDPIAFYHDLGRAQTRHYAVERWMGRREVETYLWETATAWEAEYALPSYIAEAKEGELFPVTDLWWQEPDPDKRGKLQVYEMLVCGRRDEKDGLSHIPVIEPQKRDLKRAPFVIQSVRSDPRDHFASPGFVGSSPQSVASDALRLHAQPFHYRARETLHQLEGLEALEFDAAAWDAKPFLVKEFAPQAAEQDKTQPVGPGRSATHEMGTAKYEFVARNGAVTTVRDAIQRKMDILDGIVPWTLIRLQVNPGDAALLIDKEVDHAETALVPYTLAGGAAVAETLRLLWDEFEGSGLQFKAEGVWQSGERRGDTVLVDFAESDLPKVARLQVLWPPQLPRDLMRAQQIATGLVQQGFLSRVDAHDLVLKSQNAVELVRRADLDRVAQSPDQLQLDVLRAFYAELAEEQYKLSRLSPKSPDYLAQLVLVRGIEAKVAAMMPQAPPEQTPAAPRPTSDVQPNQDQGYASREARRSGINAPRPGAMPNPAVPVGLPGVIGRTPLTAPVGLPAVKGIQRFG